MQRRHNHTIMSGRVVRFAETFVESGQGIFGPMYEAGGPYEVSASRDAVMVHRCDIRDYADIESFKGAMDEAWLEHSRLRRCDGRPDDGDTGAPRYVIEHLPNTTIRPTRENK